MGPRDAVDNIRIFLYVTGALALMIAAYLLYIRQFRRGTLQALNNVVFMTSRYDRYSAKTQFLIDLPNPSKVELKLLDHTENLTKELLNGEFDPGQHIVNFDPAEFQNGIYYLSLITDNASVMRKITIENPS